MENTEYRWRNIDANNEGYTDKFECPGCGMIIQRKSTMKDNDWTYCPVCGHKNNKELLPSNPSAEYVANKLRECIEKQEPCDDMHILAWA